MIVKIVQRPIFALYLGRRNCFQAVITHALSRNVRMLHSGMIESSRSPLSPTAFSRVMEDITDPCCYTTGRWLRNDQLERQSRFIDFNFEALCQKILEISTVGSSIVSCDKMEGGYNKVFVFTMDNNTRLVARLPTRIAGPARLTTNSEVATIKYLQSTSQIPLPHILEWSDDPTNDIGSEYIIMQHVNGVQLHQKWPQMSQDEQILCTAAVVRCIAEMAEISFPAYGSIYFEDVDVDPALKMSFAPGYIIGPHCGSTYWDCDIREPRCYSSVQPNQGPWPDLLAFCMGLIDAGYARLPMQQTIQKPSYHGSINDHVHLLRLGRKAAVILAQDSRVQRAALPVLIHPDLHKRNIYVSEENPTTITSIIDWQSSGINPAFMHVDDIPDFAALAEGSTSPVETSDKNENDLCNRAFIAGINLLVPKLKAAWQLDADICRFFECSHRTYRDGAAVFRQVLIDLSKRWPDLSLNEPCPFPSLTKEELLAHETDYRALQNAQQLKRFVAKSLNTASDGWIPNEAWEETCERHKELLNEFSKTMSADDLHECWPFDIED